MTHRSLDAVPRVVVVRCPHWPVVAAGMAPDAPVAVLAGQRVIACSRAALAAGVAIGQRRRESQRRCPELHLVDHDQARDHRVFQSVVTAVADLVPRLELTSPGMLTFPTRGPSRYLGGDDPLAKRVLEIVTGVLGERLGATGGPGVGIADGRFAAGVAAQRAVRLGRPIVVPPGGSPAFLAPMPVRWLLDDPSSSDDRTELVGLLRRLGIRTLGELAELPAVDVLARFGQPGARARRVSAGLDERPPGTAEPPSDSEVVHHFETPVQHLEALVFVGRTLAERFVGALAAGGRVCTQVLVTAETDHGERSERLWTRSTGLTVAAVVERIRWQLDGWAVADEDAPGDDRAGVVPAGERPTAGVVRLALVATDVRADEGQQLGLWGGRTERDEWAHRATARLAGLLGEERVVVPAWRGGRQPSEVYRWLPAGSCDLERSTDRVTPPPPSTGGPWPGGLPPPSPALVHDPAPEAAVFDAAGNAVTVTGRGGISAAPAVLRRGMRDEPVVAWAGPWVLEERWWDALRSRRTARFQLLTETGRAYLAAVERGRWWILAEYA